MLRLWRVKLLDPISVEPYYAPVPQVDRGLSGPLGAGVPLQVHEVPRTFSHLMEKESAVQTCFLLSTMFAYLFSILYFANSSISCDVPMGKDFQDLLLHQVEEPGGGQRDSATLPTAKH